ncbi:MAG TPA: prephenate dehydrogenase/arogenate dehydrogenase family protein [Deltaproteobacteria bacterium]|nr:prephenate dehydrogenase/arogenate dehydrogenase family protein [Deltaproteobacteria bacterium]
MRIAIIGLGLIGASIAKALNGKAEVIGIDLDAVTVNKACSEKIISYGETKLPGTLQCDMVVLAVPVGSITQTAEMVVPRMKEGTVLTDTGSTKAGIVRHIDRIWPFFVGGHPIAGKEDSGYDASQATLFKNAASIITPTQASRKDCIEKVTCLWRSLGAHVTLMDPDKHDELMAIISHLPHLLSFASMSLAGDIHIHRELLGAGFRDFTRIAASDPVMWRDIFTANRDHVLKLIDDYMEELARIKDIITRKDSLELEDVLRKYSTIRRSLYEDKR